MPSKKDYDIQYARENVIRKIVPFNRRNDEDMVLLDHAETHGNFTAYVKALIRQDLDAGKAGDKGKQGERESED